MVLKVQQNAHVEQLPKDELEWDLFEKHQGLITFILGLEGQPIPYHSLLNKQNHSGLDFTQVLVMCDLALAYASDNSDDIDMISDFRYVANAFRPLLTETYKDQNLENMISSYSRIVLNFEDKNLMKKIVIYI